MSFLTFLLFYPPLSIITSLLSPERALSPYIISLYPIITFTLLYFLLLPPRSAPLPSPRSDHLKSAISLPVVLEPFSWPHSTSLVSAVITGYVPTPEDLKL